MFAPIHFFMKRSVDVKAITMMKKYMGASLVKKKKDFRKTEEVLVIVKPLKAPPPVLARKEKKYIIIIGKSVIKKAVDRNLVKRRLRAIMQSKEVAVQERMLIIVRPKALQAPFFKLKEEVLQKLKKTKTHFASR